MAGRTPGALAACSKPTTQLGSRKRRIITLARLPHNVFNTHGLTGINTIQYGGMGAVTTRWNTEQLAAIERYDTANVFLFVYLTGWRQ